MINRLAELSAHDKTASVRSAIGHCVKLAGLVLCCLFPLMATATIAAQVDSGEDIEYRSDGGGTIENIDGMRVTTLRGNVHVRQGESQLWGDTARLEQDPETGDILRVTVEGAPARFERRLAADADMVQGSSDSIVYYLDRSRDPQQTIIEFIGDARFTSGRTALQCVLIRHFLESETTESTGPCSGVLAPRTD